MDLPTTRTEADSVIEQTLLGVPPVELRPGNFYAVRTRDGFKTVESFTQYILKVYDNDPECFDTEFVKRTNDAAIALANDAAIALAAALVPIGQAARRAQAAFGPLARQILAAERGAPLGRKRRARRARGRRRHA